MPGNDSVKINKYITFKDNDKFIRDNIYFGDIEFNTKNDATFYLSGYDDKKHPHKRLPHRWQKDNRFG